MATDLFGRDTGDASVKTMMSSLSSDVSKIFETKDVGTEEAMSKVFKAVQDLALKIDANTSQEANQISDFANSVISSYKDVYKKQSKDDQKLSKTETLETRLGRKAAERIVKMGASPHTFWTGIGHFNGEAITQLRKAFSASLIDCGLCGTGARLDKMAKVASESGDKHKASQAANNAPNEVVTQGAAMNAPHSSNFMLMANKLQILAYGLSAMSANLQGVFEISLANIFKGVLVDTNRFQERMRQIVFQTQGFGDTNRKIEKELMNTEASILQSGVGKAMYQKMYTDNLQRGSVFMTKTEKLGKSQFQLLEKQARIQKSVTASALNTATSLGMSVEGMNELFGNWHMQLGMSSNELANMGRHMKQIAMTTGVTGANLERAMKSSEDIMKNMRKTGTLNEVSAKNVIAMMASAQKLGIDDTMAPLIKAMGGGRALSQADPKTQQLIQTMITGDGNGDIGGMHWAVKSGQILKDKERMTQGKENIEARTRIALRGIVADPDKVDLTRLSKMMEKLDPQRQAILQEKLLSQVGAEAGDIEGMIKLLAENGKTDGQRLKDITVEIAKAKGSNGQDTDASKALERTKSEMETGNIQSVINSVSDSMAKDGESFSQALSSAKQKFAGQFGDEYINQIAGDPKHFDKSIDDLLKTLGKRADDAGQNLDSLAQQKGGLSEKQISEYLKSGDKDKMEKATAVLNDVTQHIGKKEGKNQDPVTNLADKIQELNTKLAGFIEYIGFANGYIKAALVILATLGAAVLGIGSFFVVLKSIVSALVGIGSGIKNWIRPPAPPNGGGGFGGVRPNGGGGGFGGLPNANNPTIGNPNTGTRTTGPVGPTGPGTAQPHSGQGAFGKGAPAATVPQAPLPKGTYIPAERTTPGALGRGSSKTERMNRINERRVLRNEPQLNRMDIRKIGQSRGTGKGLFGKIGRGMSWLLDKGAPLADMTNRVANATGMAQGLGNFSGATPVYVVNVDEICACVGGGGLLGNVAAGATGGLLNNAVNATAMVQDAAEIKDVASATKNSSWFGKAGSKIKSMFGFKETAQGTEAAANALKTGTQTTEVAVGATQKAGVLKNLMTTVGTKGGGLLKGAGSVLGKGLGLVSRFGGPLGLLLGGASGALGAKDAGRGTLEGAAYGALTGGAEHGSMFSGMLGVEKGSMTDDMLGVAGAAGSGALTGAALGSFGGPVGSAIGAGVGAVVGGGAEIVKNLTDPNSQLGQGIKSVGTTLLNGAKSAASWFNPYSYFKEKKPTIAEPKLSDKNIKIPTDTKKEIKLFDPTSKEYQMEQSRKREYPYKLNDVNPILEQNFKYSPNGFNDSDFTPSKIKEFNSNGGIKIPMEDMQPSEPLETSSLDKSIGMMSIEIASLSSLISTLITVFDNNNPIVADISGGIGLGLFDNENILGAMDGGVSSMVDSVNSIVMSGKMPENIRDTESSGTTNLIGVGERLITALYYNASTKSTGSTSGGLGLGLFDSSNILEAMDSSVSYLTSTMMNPVGAMLSALGSSEKNKETMLSALGSSEKNKETIYSKLISAFSTKDNKEKSNNTIADSGKAMYYSDIMSAINQTPLGGIVDALMQTPIVQTMASMLGGKAGVSSNPIDYSESTKGTVSSNILDYSEATKGSVSPTLISLADTESRVAQEKYGSMTSSGGIIPGMGAIEDHLAVENTLSGRMIEILERIDNNTAARSRGSTVIGSTTDGTPALSGMKMRKISQEQASGEWDLTYGDYAPGHITKV